MVFFFTVALLVSAVAAFEDHRRGEIPNLLTLGTFALAPALHFARGLHAGTGVEAAALSAGISLLGGFACGLVPYLLFVKGGARGGDVKLCAAFGALLKPVFGIEVVFYGFLAAAVLAPARLAYEGKLFSTLRTSFFLLANPMLPKSRRADVDPEAMTWIKMGPAFLVGMIITTLLHLSEMTR